MEEHDQEKKKSFFAKLFQLIDQKLEEKAKKTGCCCQSEKKNDKGDSCCG